MGSREEKATRLPLVADAGKAFSVGFILSAIPSCILKRSLKPNVRRCIAIGSFLGSFRLFYRYYLSRKSRQLDQNEEGISAASATFVMLMIDPSLTEWSVLTSYLTLKAIRALFPQIANGFSPIIAQCFSSAQLISSWLMAPQDISESHRNTCNKRFEMTSINNYRLFPSKDVNTCTVLHPASSCKKHFVRLFVGDFHRGLRLYGIFALLRVITGVAKKNLNIPDVLQLWLRSAFYYATYTALAIAAICVANKYTPGDVSRKKLFLHCWVAGLALFIESPGARVDQAIYVGSFALDSYYKTFKRMNISTFAKHSELHQSACVMLWMLLAGILVHHRSDSKYIPRLLLL